MNDDRRSLKWAVALVALCACGIIVADNGVKDASPDVANEAGAGCAPKHAATNHRAIAVACDTTRPPITPEAGGYAIGGNCKSDPDCADGGANGRCTLLGRQDAGLYCTFDSCFTDTECPQNKACTCNFYGNACVPAQCRTDSDCCGGSCSPSYDLCHMGVVGYYCHTASDTCVDDRDCPYPLEQCVYQHQVQKWACSSTCAPG